MCFWFFAVVVIDAGTQGRRVAEAQQCLGRHCETLYTDRHTRPWGPGVVEGSLSQRLCPKQLLHFEGEVVLSAVPLVSNLEHDLYKTGAIIARTDMMVACVTDHPIYSDCRSGPRIPWHM